MIDLLTFLAATPAPLSGGQRLLMMLPLCLSIAIVYKVTRSDDLSTLPAEVGGLLATILFGMAAVGIGLWVLFQIMV